MTPYSEAIWVQRCSIKIDVLKNFAKFTGKHLYQSLFFNKVADLRPVTLLKKKALAQVFSCKFCEILKNTFFTEHLWWLFLLTNILHCLTISCHQSISIPLENVRKSLFFYIFRGYRKRPVTWNTLIHILYDTYFQNKDVV